MAAVLLVTLPQSERDRTFLEIMEGETHLNIDPVTGVATMTVGGEVFLQAPSETIILPQAAVSA
jgi:hypothetical protein